MKRAGQPAELATAYVMLADPLVQLYFRYDGGRHRRQAVHLGDGRTAAPATPDVGTFWNVTAGPECATPA